MNFTTDMIASLAGQAGDALPGAGGRQSSVPLRAGAWRQLRDGSVNALTRTLRMVLRRRRVHNHQCMACIGCDVKVAALAPRAVISFSNSCSSVLAPETP